MKSIRFPEDGGYIDNQESFSGASLPFRGKTIGDCGCGVVASYNILISRGINIGFYDVYKYACTLKWVDEGLQKDEIINVICYFDPSVKITDRNPTSVLVFYGYYSYRAVDAKSISLLKREGGHVQAGIFNSADTVRMLNAVGGDNFEAIFNDYLDYIDGYVDSGSSIAGIVEDVILIR